MATITVPRHDGVSATVRSDGGAATVPLMGLAFATMSERQTIDYVLDGAAEDRGGWVCPVNLDVLRQWRRSEEIQDLVSGADLVVADGMPLLWAAGVQGARLPERVSGSALIVSLTTAAAAAGRSIFLLGGNPGVADSALERLTELCPTLEAAGTLCPPFGFEDDPEWLDRIEESVQAAAPDIVYVGLGFPKQERLIVELRKRLPQTWFISCGIAFSFVSGEIRRAPAFLQRFGLEWLHRLTQEPRRLYRRYLLHGIPFLLELLWFSLSHRRSSSGGILS